MEDPRTGLRIIKVDQSFKTKHASKKGYNLNDKVIYWFGKVKKYSRYRATHKRVLLITDRAIYICGEDAGIKRTIAIKSILEVIHGPKNIFALRNGDPKDCDVQLEAFTKQDKSDIIRIIQRAHEVFEGAEVPERELHAQTGEVLEEVVNLKKPREYKSPIIEPTPISEATQANVNHKNNFEESREHIRQVFDQVQSTIHNNLMAYRRQELDEAREEMEGYGEMIAERDAEIENLRHNYLALTENPEFWKSCPRCKAAENSQYDVTLTPDLQKRRELEKQIDDAKQLIEHLQLSRSGISRGIPDVTESSKLVSLRQELETIQGKIKQLQRMIIDNPYPTEDVRIQADQIARGEAVHVDETPRAKQLHAHIVELQRQYASKDRDLKHGRNMTKDSFKRQVQELAKVREQFQLYDSHIVDYLEKVFSANAFPQGLHSHGQTPAQIARATSQAARQAATPPAFPQHTASVDMPVSQQIPYSDRDTSRVAVSPIGQFVPPNVLSHRVSETPPPRPPSMGRGRHMTL
eukprot:TRINITY_DN19272_c0_g1_i1.p1 TRINITY_DN19272_c0_g1~~TRINITY_DN19272_c0_g1_i1.p1  ORF type:complete len:522 (+),score=107.21 TRINITY_DN19272_c0_g1_i1:36-1601(+)